MDRCTGFLNPTAEGLARVTVFTEKEHRIRGTKAQSNFKFLILFVPVLLCSSKLLDELRQVLRSRRYILRTEKLETAFGVVQGSI
jgi:hypothetical protein